MEFDVVSAMSNQVWLKSSLKYRPDNELRQVSAEGGPDDCMLAETNPNCRICRFRKFFGIPKMRMTACDS